MKLTVELARVKVLHELLYLTRLTDVFVEVARKDVHMTEAIYRQDRQVLLTLQIQTEDIPQTVLPSDTCMLPVECTNTVSIKFFQ